MGKDKRFEVLEEEVLSLMKSAVILRDKWTGVQYLYFANGNGGGITPLLDKDGKPIIDVPIE